jgi:hypothetical protein
VNQKVKAIFKLCDNRDREELAQCAVLTMPVEEFSHLSTVLCLQLSVIYDLWLSGSNEGENRDAPFQDCTTKEERGIVWFLWAEGVKPVEIHVICWLSMDRAPLVNERFMSRWKGLNQVQHMLLMRIVLIGHQHHAHKTISTGQRP